MEIPKLLKKIVFNLLAKHFVAGETVDDAIGVARELEKKGIYAIINILGEHVRDPKEAFRFRDQYVNLVLRLAIEGPYTAHVAVKPSQLGVEISQDLYRNNLVQILRTARAHFPQTVIEIDREHHEYAGIIRKVSLELAKAFQNLRLCCQINLNETIDEIGQLIEAGISIRLCKGDAYPGDFKDKREIRKRFLEQALLLSKKGNKPVAATHDLYLIDRLKDVGTLGFQVLLGIKNKEMEKLAQQGAEVGFYVPCGAYWWPYGKRRGQTILKIWWRNWQYRRER